MASHRLFNPADVTWNGKEVMALSEAVIERAYKKPSLREFHTIIPGIVAKQQVVFLGRLGLVGKKNTGNCAPTANTQEIDLTEKFWMPEYIEDRFQECWTDLQETFFVWGLKEGVNKADLTGTDFWNFLEDLLVDALEECILRLAWFGDTGAANYDDSPAGHITNGVDLDYFTPIDGLWKQIFSAVTATPSRKSGTITKNSASTYALQAFDDTDTSNKVVSKYFRSLITKADYRLRDQAGIRIYCTQSMFDQYVTELESTGLDPSFEVITEGITVLKRSGVEVVAFNFWDRYIAAYESDGTKSYLPHRALLTIKDQLQIGTEEAKNFSELTAHYDPKDKDMTIDFGFNIDAMLPEEKYMFEVIY